MRWIVVGAAGMLGQDMADVLRERGHGVRVFDRTALDVLDVRAVQQSITEVDVVVNCAAWTAVDDAETQEDAALALNATAAGTLARATADAGARLVQVSTDYVFDGSASTPYAEDAPRAPRSAYGRTKATGEVAVLAASREHLVVRTAWLYGAHGACFPRTIARLARERGSVDVVADQVGQPTWTRDVADVVVRLVEAGAPGGTYHATSAGSGSWFDLAREVVTSAGLSADVVRPTTSDAFVRPAPRPAYSVLGHEALVRAGVAPIGDWRARWAVAAAEVLA